ncbi:MAG: Lrp/AsnC family transcriptional regulator [Chloroflexota bacterium]
MIQQSEQPLKPLEEVEQEWFTNRHEYLDFFWDWATKIPYPARNSIAFAGLRRTGKTAILHRVFNRLFNEQRHVMPVFITFEPYLYRTELITTYDFAEDYINGYLRSYFAFRHRRPEIHKQLWDFGQLRQFASQTQDTIAIQLIDDYDLLRNDPQSHSPSMRLAAWLINQPKGIAGVYNIPTAIFIDEFQVLADVYDPDLDRIIPLSNYYQKPSESLIAPMVVSGSSVSLLLGRATEGALSGRLRTRILGPLAEGYAVSLVMRLGELLDIPVTEEFAYAVWDLTQGYPFAIESLMTSASPARESYPNLEALDEVVSFELTHPQGELFKHYNGEFHKYSKLLNDGQTTKQVMFWVTQYPDKRIEVAEVAEKIGVTPQEVHESLQKLENLDIVRRASMSMYVGPTEPMLKRFIAYQYDFEIQALSQEQAANNIKTEVSQELGRLTNIVGHFAEIAVGAVMKGFDGQTLDGPRFFSTPNTVFLPRFMHIENRWGVIADDSAAELDLVGEYRWWNEEIEERVTSAWFVQVKYRKEKVTRPDAEAFLTQIDAIQTVKGYAALTNWYVSKGGFTEPAQDLLAESSIYYTDLAQFNALAKVFGYLGFPERVRG